MKKTKLKRIISLVLVMSIVFTMLNGITFSITAAEATSGTDENGYAYTSDGTSVTITGHTPINSSSLFYGIEFEGHYYGISTDSLTWTDAKAACETNGGYLVSINTAEEQAVIEQLLNFSSSSYKWIGAHKADGLWQWTDGEVIGYNNWNTNQPSSSANYSYINYSGYRWYGTNSTSNSYFYIWMVDMPCL